MSTTEAGKKALEALRVKYKEVTGNEPGKTLGANQLKAGIEKFNAEKAAAEAGSTGDNSANAQPAAQTVQDPAATVDPAATPDVPAATGAPDATADPAAATSTDPAPTQGGQGTGTHDTYGYSPEALESYGVMKLNQLRELVTPDTTGQEKIDMMQSLIDNEQDPLLKAHLSDKLSPILAEAQSIVDAEAEQNRRKPIPKSELKTELIWIRKEGTHEKKQVSKYMWDNYTSKAPGKWKKMAAAPKEVLDLTGGKEGAE